MYLCRFLTH